MRLHPARRIAAALCWLGAAWVVVLAADGILSGESDLSPDDPLYGAYRDLGIIVASVFGVVGVSVFVGAALLLSNRTGPARATFLSGLAIAAFAWFLIDAAIVFALIASGAFLLLWRFTDGVWPRRAALGALLLTLLLALAGLLGCSVGPVV